MLATLHYAQSHSQIKKEIKSFLYSFNKNNAKKWKILQISKAQKRARAKVIFGQSKQPAMMPVPVTSEEKHDRNQTTNDNFQ